MVRSISARRRIVLAIVVAAVLGLGLSSCSTGYVLRSAWYQAELLGSRVPIQKARESGSLSAAQLAALDRIADVKAFGREIGLASTDNYETIALHWNRRIWNLSVCAPLAFTPKTWWFPIVGRVPYLGYFERAHADAAARRWHDEGWDVYVRETAAYSTLGWFRDPILPSMLSWGELDLADTVLHELAHATLWVKGSVAFNESFASFVGEEGAFRYLAARHGEGADVWRRAREEREDAESWRIVQRALVADLDAVYTNASLSPEAKRARKAELLAAFADRVAAASFHEPTRYVHAARDGVWNNARLAQFRTYNSNRPAFEALLRRSNGDLLAFVDRVRLLAKRGEPFAELERAAGAAP